MKIALTILTLAALLLTIDFLVNNADKALATGISLMILGGLGAYLAYNQKQFNKEKRNRK